MKRVVWPASLYPAYAITPELPVERRGLATANRGVCTGTKALLYVASSDLETAAPSALQNVETELVPF